MEIKHEKRRNTSIFVMGSLFLLLLFVVNFGVAQVADSPSLRLSGAKVNGYAAFGDINGVFRFSAETSSDIVWVEFYLDDNLEFNATSAPFRWSFDTNNYAFGAHTFRVVGVTLSGETASETRQYNFISFPIVLNSAFLGTMVVNNIFNSAKQALIAEKSINNSFLYYPLWCLYGHQ